MRVYRVPTLPFAERPLTPTQKALVTFVVLGLAFGLAPLPGGDDWLTMTHAAQRIVNGGPLYGVQDPHYYANPPHLAALLIPLTWFPLRLTFALVLAASLTLVALLMPRWCAADAPLKTVLVIFSPPMIYLLLHGQIDLLILACVLLPPHWWGLAALTKPQMVIGLVFGIPRVQWVKAGVIVGVVLAGSLLIWGNWMTDWLTTGQRVADYPHNFWRGLWPFQVPLGLFFVLQGVKRHDDKLLIAGSPFLSPYAALSSFVGVWMVALCHLDRWQAVGLWGAWWGVVLVRAG